MITREQAKDVLLILQAFVEGKEIQSLTSDGRWVNGGEFLSKFDIEVMVTNPEFFRIKPEPKYRPFQSAEECWQEMQKHQPFGWVKTEAGEYRFIDRVTTEIHLVDQGKSYSAFCGALESFTFTDGTPFGKLEE